MSSFKKLSKSDVTVVPYAANKQWILPYCPYPTSSEYITIYKGTNFSSSFSLDDDLVTEGQYERLVYSQINQLFYQSYTSSLDTSSLMFTLNNYESASQQRPTSSYFIYNDSDNLIQNFPTGINDSGSIRVMAINQNIYGSKVLPHHFILSSSAYYVVDDGFGNLYNLSASSAGAYISGGYFSPDEYFVPLDPNASNVTKTHVGNIYYAHGLAVITDKDYQNIFPLPPIAKNNTGSFLTTDTKVVSASLNDYARSGTLDTGSLVLSGSITGVGYSWATGSKGTVVLTTTVPGTYTVYYTIGANIAGSCATQLRSNKAKVKVDVAAPPTTTTTTTSTTTTTTTVPTTTTSTTTSTTTVPTTTTTSTTTSTTTVPTTTTTTSTTTSTTTVPTTTTTTSTTTTTTTNNLIQIDWVTGPKGAGAGQLEIRDYAGVSYLNETTVPLTKSGSLFLSSSQAPFSVTGSWSAGSGNIVRYRICDITNGGEVFYSGDIDVVTGSVSYFVSPTPLHTKVWLTSGASNTPPSC